MNRNKQKASEASRERFIEGATEPGTGLIAEFWAFFLTNKKWWLIPIVISLLLLAGLVMFSGTALAPFIYPFF
jgi:hypothetical protein